MAKDKEPSDKQAAAREEWKELIEYFDTMLGESDRGAVLLVVAKLDEWLRELHEAHIAYTVEDSKSLLAELFRPMGPLASLYARIALAHAYGLISDEEAKELHTLREIRNKAAHSGERFTLEKWKDKIYDLKAIKRAGDEFPDLKHLPNSGTWHEMSDQRKRNTPPKLSLIVSAGAITMGISRKAFDIRLKHIAELHAKKEPAKDG